jgi:DUF1680 family protein
MEAHPSVEAAHNRLAVLRGPLLYCLESADLPPDVPLAQVRLPKGMKLEARRDAALLGGVTVLEGVAQRASLTGWDHRLYRPARRDQEAPESLMVRFIPYYATANRDSGEMAVWLPVGD